MTLVELAKSNILPKASTKFILCKPLCGRYVETQTFDWTWMSMHLLEPEKLKRPFPWANDEVVEIRPSNYGIISIFLKEEI